MIGYVIGAVVLLALGFIAYRTLKVKTQANELNEARYERIRSLVDIIERGGVPTAEEVAPFALGLGTREATFDLLLGINRLDLFPSDLVSIQKSAEANMSTWLEFPTELDALPDEIEHVRRVTIPFDEANRVHYEVFRFRVNEPHWAAADGWLLGVVGPYFDDSKPYDFPGGTFSRFKKFGTVEPEEEVAWVHENIAMRRG